jgi:hypothetical protein
MDKRLSGSTPQAGGADRRNDERRRHQRFPFNATADIVEPRSNTHINGRTSDLGQGGCYVDTLSPFPAGTLVKIRISRESQSFEAEAKVSYSVVGMGMGLAFTAIQPEHVKIFRSWILDLGGTLPAEVDVPSKENKAAGGSGELSEGHSRVLHELITVLMRRGILAEAEGKEFLRKLTG